MAIKTPTPHISAMPGDFAKTVLMPGDPLRSKFIAETFLENPVLVNNVRGVQGYTGTYKGVKVSVMASGMGMPSMGIYSHELFNGYGVENIIRIGSSGSALPAMSVVVADKSYSDSSFAKVGFGYEENVMYPDPDLTQSIVDTAKKLGKEVYVGPIGSGDVFYGDPKVQAQGTKYDETPIAGEMESFALFANARYLGKNAACVCTVSDSFGENGEEISAEDRQVALRDMMVIALEAAIAQG